MTDVIDIARYYLFVREAKGQMNGGQRVNAIQWWSGGKDALDTSWCAWFATMCLDIAFQGNSPIPRGGSCEAIRQQAEDNGWFTDDPEPGDLVLSINAAGVAHHIGFYVEELDPDTVSVLAGNTSADGSSANGDRVAEHGVPKLHKVYVKYPRTS